MRVSTLSSLGHHLLLTMGRKKGWEEKDLLEVIMRLPRNSGDWVVENFILFCLSALESQVCLVKLCNES